jgi:hypothetical protein
MNSEVLAYFGLEELKEIIKNSNLEVKLKLLTLRAKKMIVGLAQSV